MNREEKRGEMYKRGKNLKEKMSEKELEARSKICLPLDGISDKGDLLDKVSELHGAVGLFKIGKELFTWLGPDSIKMIQRCGGDIFLDLKYHDIPNTVRGAARAAAYHGVKVFNIHATGGIPMMRAAKEGAYKALEDFPDLELEAPAITGVTVLTSLDEAAYLQMFQPLNPELEGMDFTKYIDMKKDDEQLMEEFQALLEKNKLKGIVARQVAHLAGFTHEAGLNGIVCSPADLYAVKDKMPEDFMYITPGVKAPTGAVGSDQKRVFTPYEAVKAGSTYLVVGRAITKNDKQPDKLLAAYDVVQDAARAL